MTPYVGVITIFIQKLLKGENLSIFGDGTQVRDFVSVDDVSSANLLVMDYTGPIQIFNIGSGSGIDINSIAQLLKKAMKKSSKNEYLPKHPGEPTDSIADITLAKNELNFRPLWSLEEKLPEVIEWNKNKKT